MTDRLPTSKNETRWSVILWRSLDRLHRAVKDCARIGFQESSPTNNATHAEVWNYLNEAQSDAALKLDAYSKLSGNSSAPETQPASTIQGGPPFTVERYGSLGESVIAERDWLRSRLERIAKYPDPGLDGANAAYMRGIARKALSDDGPVHETPKDGLAALIQRHALTREGALALVRQHRFSGESPPLTEETTARQCDPPCPAHLCAEMSKGRDVR